jgi:hypothetical protein
MAGREAGHFLLGMPATLFAATQRYVRSQGRTGLLADVTQGSVHDPTRTFKPHPSGKAKRLRVGHGPEPYRRAAVPSFARTTVIPAAALMSHRFDAPRPKSDNF